MIPFESMEAKMFNAKAFKQIQEQSIQASKELANIYGEPEMLKGYGMRILLQWQLHLLLLHQQF